MFQHEDQVVCSNELGDNLDDVSCSSQIFDLKLILLMQESFFQDIDVLQNHGIVSLAQLFCSFYSLAF